MDRPALRGHPGPHPHLAARTDPAHPAVGETFTVTSYAWAPSGDPTVVWCTPALPCDPEAPLVAELAGLDWSALDETERAQRRQQALEAGIVGVEPAMPVIAAATPLPQTGDVLLLAYAVPPEGSDIEQATLTFTPAPPTPIATRSSTPFG